MRREIRIGLIIVSIIALILAGYAYFTMAKQLIRNKGELNRVNSELIQEIKKGLDLEEALKAAEDNLKKAQSELDDMQGKFRLAEQKLIELEQRNVDLVAEKNQLEAKMSSLKGLKLAIKEFKLELHRQKLERAMFKKKQQEERDAIALAEGNRGFVIKDGQPSYRPKVKINVIPMN